MTPTPQRVRDLFLAAVRRPAAEWGAYLAESCAGDDDLRREARELLDAHQAAGSFLESPALELDATRDLPLVTEHPGTVIGSYKLLEQLGEGGFGFVFMAEQTQPVRRKVALKVIKPGMDTRQVVARFEAERQALALMDHPQHRPRVRRRGHKFRPAIYFVMELVKAPRSRTSATSTTCRRGSGWSCSSGVRGGAARPPEGNHPPRPQAVKCPRVPGTMSR